MNKEYWYPWKPNKYKGATMHLTALQDGIYRRLIDHYMETKEPLPDNDDALARIAGVTVDMFGDNAGVIRKFFKSNGKGRLKNKECDDNLRKEKKLSQTKAENGRKGGKKKAENQKEKQEVTSTSQEPAKHQHSKPLQQNTTGQNTTVDNSTESDSFKSINKISNSLIQNLKSFSLRLNDEELARAKAAAPGWDIYNLQRQFEERVNSGQFERPKSPAAAFVAWCKSFTKGNKP